MGPRGIRIIPSGRARGGRAGRGGRGGQARRCTRACRARFASRTWCRGAETEARLRRCVSIVAGPAAPRCIAMLRPAVRRRPRRAVVRHAATPRWPSTFSSRWRLVASFRSATRLFVSWGWTERSVSTSDESDRLGRRRVVQRQSVRPLLGSSKSTPALAARSSSSAPRSPPRAGGGRLGGDARTTLVEIDDRGSRRAQRGPPPRTARSRSEQRRWRAPSAI